MKKNLVVFGYQIMYLTPNVVFDPKFHHTKEIIHNGFNEYIHGLDEYMLMILVCDTWCTGALHRCTT